MGAADFYTTAKGDTAREAFRTAVEDAQYEHGHGGYSGTIAEKTSFKMVTPLEGESTQQCVDRNSLDDRFDKYGPAGCIKLEEGVYAFFGEAAC